MKKLVVLLVLLLVFGLLSNSVQAGRWEKFAVEIHKEIITKTITGAPTFWGDAGGGTSSVWAKCTAKAAPPGQTGVSLGLITVKVEYMLGYWWIEDYPFEPPTEITMYYKGETFHNASALGYKYSNNGFWSLYAFAEGKVDCPPFRSKNKVGGSCSSGTIIFSEDSVTWIPEDTDSYINYSWESFIVRDMRHADGDFYWHKASNGSHFVSITAKAEVYSIVSANITYSPGRFASSGSTTSMSIDMFIIEE